MSILKKLERLLEGEKKRHHKHKAKRRRTPARKKNGEFRKSWR